MIQRLNNTGLKYKDTIVPPYTTGLPIKSTYKTFETTLYYLNSHLSVTMEEYLYETKDGKNETVAKIDESHSLFKEATLARQQLTSDIGDLDDEFLQMLIEKGEEGLTIQDFKNSIRKITLAQKAVPVFIGSAFKNKGVQPLMDGIIDYLPSPLDVNNVKAKKIKDYITDSNGVFLPQTENELFDIKSDPKGPLVALAFKVVHDQYVGLIVYVRVYSGSLKAKIFNSSKNMFEKAIRTVHISADDLQDVKSIETGDIGAVIGLKHTSTGDTLVTSKHKPYLLDGITTPPPVFFGSLEAETQKQYQPLLDALGILAKEDPSLTTSHSKETNQLLVSGMGELHFEIIKDRLLNHFKLPVNLGQVFIAYRSTLPQNSSLEYFHSQQIQMSDGQTEKAELEIRIFSKEPGSGNSIEINIPELKKSSLTPEMLLAIENGVKNGFERGSPSGYPLVDVGVEILDFEELSQNLRVIESGACFAVCTSAEKVGAKLLEPIMRVELTIDPEYLGVIMTDLTGSRRGSILDITHGIQHLIRATVPLKEIVGYSKYFRQLAKGTGSFTMEFLHFGVVSQVEQQRILSA